MLVRFARLSGVVRCVCWDQDIAMPESWMTWLDLECPPFDVAERECTDDECLAFLTESAELWAKLRYWYSSSSSQIVYIDTLPQSCHLVTAYINRLQWDFMDPTGRETWKYISDLQGR